MPVICKKLWTLFYISLFFNNFALANFVAQKEFCTVSNSFTGQTSEGEKYSGSISLSFVKKTTNLPLFSVSLSRNIKPVELSFSWPNAKLKNSNGKDFFEPEFQERITAETKKVFEFNEENTVFFSKAYSFYRFQSLIALFLSQNNLLLSFKLENAQTIETLVVPLSGSDRAFREMTHHCHFDFVEEYIQTDLSSERSIFESWSVGYGLTKFTKYEPLLPAEVKYPNDTVNYLKQDSDISYNKLDEIYQLLVKKYDLNEQIYEIEQDQDYISLRNEIDKSATQVFNLSSQKDLLDGDLGLIQGLRQDLSSINDRILVSKKLIDTYEAKLNPKKEQLEVLKIKILELQLELSEYKNQIEQKEAESKTYETNLKNLKEVIAGLAGEYSENELKEVAQEPLSPPYTLEEIESSYIAINDDIQKRAELKILLDLMDLLGLYIDELSLSHKTARDAYNQIAELKIKRVQLEENYSREQLEKIQMIESLDNIDLNNINQLISKDKQAERFKGLKNADVNLLLTESIKEQYNEYDKIIEQQKSNQQDLWPHIVCTTGSFFSSYVGQCLDPTSFEDTISIDLFMDQLGSFKLGQLNEIYTGINNPLQRYNTNLVDLLSEKIKLEIEQANAKSIQSLWLNILYDRWYLRAVRSQKSENEFTFSSLQDSLDYQKNQIKKMEDAKNEFTAEIVNIDIQLNELNSRFMTLESKYNESLIKNQNLIFEQVKERAINLDNTSVECLLSITNIELCFKDVDDFVSESEGIYDQTVVDIKEAVKFLVLSTRYNFIQIEKSLNESLAETNDLLAQKNEYIKTSGYNEEKKIYDLKNNEYNRQVVILKSLYEQKHDLEMALQDKSSEKTKFEARLKSLSSKIQVLVNDMKPTLVKLRPICNQKNELSKSIFKIDTQIFNVLGLSGEPKKMNSLCQIDL